MKLLQQGISNPEFYGDLVHKFKKISGYPNFSDLFKRIVNRLKTARYTAVGHSKDNHQASTNYLKLHIEALIESEA